MGTHHTSRSGKSNSTAPRKNTNPGKLNFREAGYIELKMNAPIKLNKVSKDAMAENSAPEKNNVPMMYLMHLKKYRLRYCLRCAVFCAAP